MSKKHRDLTADEKKLWRRVAASVKSRRLLSEESKGVEERPAPERAAQSVPRTPAVASERPAPAPLPRDRGNEKRVRRGKLEIGAKLDLHGYTQDTARAALSRFLRSAQSRGDRIVIVITGVGRAGEGVLKRRFPDWLAERDIRPFVSGYAPAHRAHGGAGAFYVFIRRAD